jgi:hypothetical protein
MLEDYKQVYRFFIQTIIFYKINISERLVANVEEHRQDQYYGVSSPSRILHSVQTSSIQIGTHADSLIAEAVLKNITSGFDMELAWEAVWKDATVPPENDWEKLYDDQEKCVRLSNVLAC